MDTTFFIYPDIWISWILIFFGYLDNWILGCLQFCEKSKHFYLFNWYKIDGGSVLPTRSNQLYLQKFGVLEMGNSELDTVNHSLVHEFSVTGLFKFPNFLQLETISTLMYNGHWNDSFCNSTLDVKDCQKLSKKVYKPEISKKKPTHLKNYIIRKINK